ncbi:NAD+ synthase [Pseudosulfitobacter pseudonitzschiae]|uniref:NAD+ synthase n=1 Tax=Pseudosulfitobacter pseudonitzschiae TaxID=1402135 RepID=UPI003B779011
MIDPKLTLALIQDNATVGDIEGNVAKIHAHIDANMTADLIVFPEMFLTGYPLGDLVTRPSFLAQVGRALQDLSDWVVAQEGPSILVGAPQSGDGLPYNGAWLIEPSGAMRVVRKTELPNSDVFDERRTFLNHEGQNLPLPFKGFNLGVMICEDMWHGRVARNLADEMADILIALNGSPFHVGKQSVRIDHAKNRVRATGLPLIYLNLTGAQDEIVFDGASFVLNANGSLDQMVAFQNQSHRVVVTRTEEGVMVTPETEISNATYPDKIASKYSACVLGLRDYVSKIGNPRVVIGVSGGLDSALVAAMAVDALGADRVIGVMMPSQYTGGESLGLADELMERLGIHRQVLPIGDAYEAVDRGATRTITALAAGIGIEAQMGVTRENFQARLRGLYLMGLTNALGAILLSTGNKSEMSVGYATLYGDMNGGFNPLKSIWKTEAFEMCRWRNLQSDLALVSLPAKPVSNPIPDGIITRPPTAELADDQSDTKSLGDYEILDTVLKLITEEQADHMVAAFRITEIFGEEGVLQLTGGEDANAYAFRIARLVRGAQYKRDQSCPGPKTNRTDYGLGWRYPIAGTYQL